MNSKYHSFREFINKKEIAVIGIGISNIPLIKLLRSLGGKVCAFDKKNKEQLGKIYDELENHGVSFSLGDNYLKSLNHEIIFKTPGIRYDIPELLEAEKNGSIITSEMEVFFEICPCKIIGITGSDGKTTTTTLIYKLLSEEGYNCWLGGNIGRPLLGDVENIDKDDIVVLELSSFQLHTMKKSPDIAVITNLSPNHLDMHKSMEEYIDAKRNIYKYQNNASRLIINNDNDITKSFYNDSISNKVLFSRKNKLVKGIYIDNNFIVAKQGDFCEEILNINDIALLGVHNIENYMAAIGAVYGMVSKATIIKVAKNFKGVEHRLEFVREISGISFFNDSIASSPTRTIAGLNSFNKKIILIAGGYDKNISFNKLGNVIINKVKNIILIGKTADKIIDAINMANIDNINLPIIKCNSLKEAVIKAYDVASEGDIVLLSPACASFDMFKNFEERGNIFKEIVKGL
jgi:UDP-N-acetylmuramoylalanine--D-glutamate ligase